MVELQGARNDRGREPASASASTRCGGPVTGSASCGKRSSLGPAEQAREDVAQARAEWAAAAPTLRPENLVFGDESGVDVPPG